MRQKRRLHFQILAYIMKELKDKLLGEVSEEYGVIDDIYCYALSSKRNR